MPRLILICTFAFFITPKAVHAQVPTPVKLQFEKRTSISGTSRWDWWQARTANVPASQNSGTKARWLTTMSETGKTGVHDFHDIYFSTSDDAGKTWTKPVIVPSLRRKRMPDGYEVAAGDLWPTWHRQSGVVLATGKTFNFERGKREVRTRERVSYVVWDPTTEVWGPLRLLELPTRDHSKQPIVGANAGCVQRVDLPNGEILLPIRYWRDPKKHNYTCTVARCRFDGNKLTYVNHGTEMTIARDRGLYEPSVIRFAGRYFLTMRADHSAYVTCSDDGLNYQPIREWTFDDGKPLRSYNTQQHWLMIGKGLFLVYTRKGAGNDHIMRHRAPLFIGQVNPQTLQVMRSTERILIPENHATLGNSGVCQINDQEALVTCGEGLLRLGKRKGENNVVHFVRVNAK